MNVIFEIKDQVAYVTLNRPRRMNAIDAETDNELENIWQTIEADKQIRCVVLSGAGEKAFCAGADMKAANNLTGLEYWANGNKNGFGGIAMRDSLEIPIIAKVNGFALGGGFEMILGCDIVVASEKSFFGLPESRVGRLPLDGGMVLLQRQIPTKIAAGMLLSGRKMNATQAYQYGLINDVVANEADDENALDLCVQKWVEDIKRCAPLSVRALKHTLNNTNHLSPKEAQAQRSDALIKALKSKDSDEGVKAFLEKRAPKWQGE